MNPAIHAPSPLAPQRRARLRLVLVVLAAGWAAACGSSPTAPSPAPRPPVVPDPGPALTLSCPADQAATAALGATTATVSFTTPTAAGGTAPVTVACTGAPAGNAFPIGRTTVTCRATDAASQATSCSFTVTVDAAAPQLSKSTFLAFGDSLTAGEVTVPVATPAGVLPRYPSFALRLVPSASYPTQLAALVRAAYPDQSGIAITNAGKSGEWAVDGVARFTALMQSLRPEVVLLLSGYNDLAALGTSGISPASAAVEAMAKDARFRGAEVFIATLPPPRPGGQNTQPVSTVVSYNDRLKVVASGEQARVVDLYEAMLGGETAYIGVDGLHPTEAGYQKMAEVFFAAIRDAFEVR
ncbi:MAG: GDSL-type esterase/lipase family protein [Vicinamibacterales bacterium]